MYKKSGNKIDSNAIKNINKSFDKKHIIIKNIIKFNKLLYIKFFLNILLFIIFFLFLEKDKT
jgi:hypothetical protein